MPDSSSQHWPLVTLNDLGEVNRGRSRHRPRYAEHLYGGAYPFIQTGDIKASGGRIRRHQQTYSDAGLAQSRIWPARTMVITIAANIADTALLTYPACFPDSVIGFIADETKALPEFVEYKFRALKKSIQAKYVGTGSAQDNINLEVLGKLRFPLPPITIQKSIVEVLGALDEKILSNEVLSEAAEACAAAIFKSWFVDFGPVRSKLASESTGLADSIARLFPDRLVEQGGGILPDGWSFKPLSELGRFLNGLALQKFPPKGPEFLPVIKIAELRAGRWEDGDRASCDIPPEYIVNDGDLIFSWSGSLLQRFWCGGRGALNQHLFKVTPRGTTAPLLFEAINQHMARFRAIASDKATTMGHIQRQHLDSALVAVGSVELMKLAEVIIGSCHERAFHARVQSRTLEEIRDLVLPKLVSGELRVSDAESIVGKAGRTS